MNILSRKDGHPFINSILLATGILIVAALPSNVNITQRIHRTDLYYKCHYFFIFKSGLGQSIVP